MADEEEFKKRCEVFRNLTLHYVNQIVEVFNDFYGEEYVDCVPNNPEELDFFIGMIANSEAITDDFDHIVGQTPNNFRFALTVYFPEVTISNERGSSTVIQDLYVTIPISKWGKIGGNIEFRRATYPLSHFIADYLHSHISGIPDNPRSGKTPCLGRGPIKTTLARLSANFDIDNWRLLCLELSLFVPTESLEGGPYRKLENISPRALSPYKIYTNFRPRLAPEYNNNDCQAMVKYVVTDLIKDPRLKVVRSVGPAQRYQFNGTYTIGLSMEELDILISNRALDFFREEEYLWDDISEYFERVYFIDGKFKRNSNDRRSTKISSFVDRYVITFKGETIKSKVVDNLEKSTGPLEVRVLRIDLLEIIVTQILLILNFYGTSYFKETPKADLISENIQFCV